jgi:GNAT superfamily N-acetyltransferase
MAETQRSDDRERLLYLSERVQTEWFTARALRLGGSAWDDGPLFWTDGPDGQNLMFPRAIPLNALDRGIERAREHGHELVGAWLENETDASALADRGFERGWAPWWMAADLGGIQPASDPRIHLGVLEEDIADEPSGYGEHLELARLEPERAFYAAARVDGSHAGHAWAYLDGETAGIFDLDVWPPFRRTGLGAGLLHAVADAARDAGARTAVLSTSPQGAIVYRAQGFRRIGQGSTWWLHLD